MYGVLLIFLLVFLLLLMQLPLNFVLSTDDGFFVVPEDKIFNPGDYGGESSLSSEGGGNYSGKFKNEDVLYNINPKKLAGLASFTDFNFALAGDWGCTKNTAKTVDLIQNHDPELVFNFGDTSYEKDINCWVDIVQPISNRMEGVIGNHDVMSQNLSKQHLKQFGLDKPYYSFDYNNIIF